MRKALHTAVIAMAVLGALVGFSGSAHASAPNPNFVTTLVTFNSQTGLATSRLTDTFLAGDCFVSLGSEATLSRPDSLGQSVLDWGGIVGTHHTNNFDQWHVTWTFRNSSGTVLAVLGPIDGPQMSSTSVQYLFNKPIPVHLSFDNWAHIASATWRGEC